ncbi:MAG TPA: alpha/beta hydrolase [Alphaproteobacteria bacterium]
MFLIAGLSLSACAPRFVPAGPPVTAPALDLAADAPALVTADGLRLPLRSWQPSSPANGGAPKAMILALHGFNDYSNAFEDAGAFWAARGIATYAYDQRGFGAAADTGRWAGLPAYVDDLRTAAALLRARHPGVPLFILGESMGGAIVMSAMTNDDPPTADGVILVAPAVWDRSHMPFYQTVPLWLATHTVPWMRLSASGLDILPSDNIDMLRKLSADPLVIKSTRIDTIGGLVDLMDTAFDAAAKLGVPSLVLYGNRDEVVPKEPTLDMMAKLPRTGGHTVAIYSHGYHMLLRDLQGEAVMADILSWIAAPAGGLPSGADAAASRELTSAPAKAR